MFRFTVTVLIIFNTFFLYSQEYILESATKLKDNVIKINENYISTTVELESTWTDSYGEYGTAKCNGHILSKNKSETINVYCEQLASNGDKFWTKFTRKSSDISAGIGKVIYLKGEGKYKKLENKECTYAIRYMDKKTNFLKLICKLGTQ